MTATGDPDTATPEPDAPDAPQATAPLRAPRAARDRLQQLYGVKREVDASHAALQAELDALRAHLDIADGVGRGLDILSDRIFGDTVKLLEEKLTIALREVLDQKIALEVESRYLRGSAAIEFHIKRHGKREHIIKGQGGSVANILSVGLRMFALTTLDPDQHRRFLVLDEQDCWLRPDLVPRLVQIVHDAAKALGFQVLMISHHDWRAFRQHADKIYRLRPAPGGVRVVEWEPPAEAAPVVQGKDGPPGSG